MRPADTELLKLLAEMPFLDRLEATALSGWSRGAVYGAVSRLEDAGLIASLSHGTGLLPPTRRFYLSARGMHQLSYAENELLEDLLRDHPVSVRWRRVLLERLDAVALIYRLVSAISDAAFPISFRWFRAMPMDAAAILPGGGTLGIVRQGTVTDRTGFSKRLWRLGQEPLPGVILMVMPDEVRLRHARRMIARAAAPALFSLESEVSAADPDAPVWRLGSVKGTVTLRAAMERLERKGALAAERPLVRGVSIPPDIDRLGQGADVPGYLLPARLRPTEKRALDLISDWPWLGLEDLAGLLAVSRSRASQVALALEGLGLVIRTPASGRRLALADRGLAVLARRDRASVGEARKRWSAVPRDADDWRSVSGRGTRQLLRNLDHTDAVHGFVAALARQSRGLEWDVAQLDPPRRASRYFRHFGARRSIHPDAFGLLKRNGAEWAFFLEWERRAVRPVTMAARLAPYLRYYSTQRPIDDHGVRPFVLVVFHDELAASHFLRVALREMTRTRTFLPLLVSHRELVEREGPLGPIWLAPGGGGPKDIISEN